jgi:lysophospholipase L1-like esterase
MRLHLLAASLAAALAALPAPAADFPLKDGDIWVMAGDSITAQHLHSNYFEAFCYARYPKLKFAFRNSGVGGDTIPRVLARYEWDIAPWKPTVVSVELGMNDQGGYTVEQFLANMEKLVARIRQDKARPVLLSSSPINNGQTLEKLGKANRLHAYAVALKEYAAKEHIPYADQFHALVDVWAANKPKENLLNTLNTVKGLAAQKDLEGAEHLRKFLEINEPKAKGLVSMQGDPVHPGAPGQLMMAAALLKGLGAEPFVSSAVLDAKGKVLDAKGCAVSEMKAETGKITFERLDECLPFPIPDDARVVLPLYPTILEMSQYTLAVKDLSEGSYTLRINGTDVATCTAKELAAGVNLTAYGKGPIAAQGKEVLAAVNAKEGLVGQWRGLSRAVHSPTPSRDGARQLAELTKKVEAADVAIREAAKPRKLKFEITAAK